MRCTSSARRTLRAHSPLGTRLPPSSSPACSRSDSARASHLSRSLLVALAAAVSRSVVGVHWPLDVLGGAFGGWLAAAAGLALAQRVPGAGTITVGSRPAGAEPGRLRGRIAGRARRRLSAGGLVPARDRCRGLGGCGVRWAQALVRAPDRKGAKARRQRCRIAGRRRRTQCTLESPPMSTEHRRFPSSYRSTTRRRTSPIWWSASARRWRAAAAASS